MDRSKALHTLEQNEGIWDVLVIGGGASGLGAAIDAAQRGFRTILLVAGRFCKRNFKQEY